MPRAFKTFLLGLGAIALYLSGHSPTDSHGKDKSALRFRLTADPATLDWNLAQGSHETYIIMNLMEGLTEVGDDLKPRAALAEKWETSSDGKTYVFHLRTGVIWSDGRPLRAADFVNSWLRLLDPNTRSAYAHFLFDVENAEAFHSGKLKDSKKVGIKATGPSTLQVSLRRPVSYFPHLTSFWVTFPIRSDLIRIHGSRWTQPGKIVTLGPFQLAEWKKGKWIRLKANPSYYAKSEKTQPPGSRVMEAVAIVEPNDRKTRTQFEQGKLDFLLDATTEDLLKHGNASQAAIRVRQFPYLATYYLGFNVRKGPLKDVNIRRALALAIDRGEIPATLQGGQIPAKGWLPPGIEGHGPAVSASGTLYDARGALSRAGYTEGQGFPRLTVWLRSFDGSKKLAELIARSLHDKLGIEIKTRIATPSEYQKALKSGEADLFVRHWGADFPDPASFFEVFLSGSGANATGWSSHDYDKHVEHARSALDPKARSEAYLKAERLLIEQDVVIHPLFYRQNAVLLGPRIREFRISPLNYLFLKSVSLVENAESTAQ